jgi:hypothetical protein
MNIIFKIFISLIIILICFILYFSNSFDLLEINNTSIAIPVKTLHRLDEISKFYDYISQSERKIFSQNKEDGVIEKIFDLLNLRNLKKYFVEFSPADGMVNNLDLFFSSHYFV